MKKNKKGFTLTELIVVIVIIGILAAVLIPTLTGYIKKAEKSAAEQEAQPYITAFMSWQIETDDAQENLESFKAYCVQLELVKDLNEANDVIVFVNSSEKIFIIKSNDLYVLWQNNKLTVTEEHPDKELIDKRIEFKDVIEEKLPQINSYFTNNAATLNIKNVNADGSVNIEAIIKNSDATAFDVYEPVTKAIEEIKANGGKSIYVTPIIGDKEYSIEEFQNKAIDILGESANEYFPLTLDEVDTVGLLVSQVLVFEDSDDFGSEEWSAAWFELLQGELGDLVGKNKVKVVANIENGVDEYQVIYYFDFVSAK